MEQMDGLSLLACGLVGGGAALLVWWVLRALASDDLSQGSEWRYDVSRINELRRQDMMFRVLQPLIQFVARFIRGAFGAGLPEVTREIHASGLSRCWLPEEYLARQTLVAVFLWPAMAYVCWTLFDAPGIFLSLMMLGVTIWWMRLRLARQAARRVLLIKRRLPYLLDLLTLLMEAGSSFINALQQAVKEFGDHPVGVEFGRVLADMNMGKARIEAFDNLRKRLSDDEMTSIIGSIIQSEQLGTPLSAIFRTQADVLRVKRSQRAETLANEAAVQMLLPGVLVMAATVLIILGPFLLGYLYSGFGF
ncbi:MAG: type II secretion system F family protein [Planctomycetota bacterium]